MNVNRRIDPESTGPIHWPSIWRQLKVKSNCRTVGRHELFGGKDVWDGDLGYCLDRPNTRGELVETLRITQCF